MSWNWASQRSAAPIPEPSAPGGYYDQAFTLRLNAPANGKIYYTTDGSAPTEDSTVYDGGILLENRSGQPNLYSSIPNVVRDWKNVEADENPVPKGTVIRAVFINDWGIASDILTQTYFIGIAPPPKGGYALSLVFAYDDLFGPDGIYVTGAEYDAWHLSGDSGEEEPTPNFEKELEVMVTAELLNDSGDVLNQNAGLRIQGSSARWESKKRFTLTARQEYSGSDVFDVPLYDGVKTHSVMLKSFFTDAIVADMVADRSVAVQRSIPVRLYLNGEYWYDCYMLERYDSEYFRQHYGVDNRVLAKDGALDEEVLENAGLDFYNEFMFWAGHTDFTDPGEWGQFQKEADLQSQIDYLVINYYFCNFDFDESKNYVLWRSPTVADDQYGDGRWRWCIYDIDTLSWAHYYSEYGKQEELNIFSNEFAMDVNDSAVYRSLRRNPEYCQQFVLSFMDMLNNNFAPANAERVLKKYGYDLSCLDGYFLKRPEYAVKHLAEEFQLTGNLETVVIRCADPEMGSVMVNTSTIDLSSGSWSGQYFTDYPITVTATAQDGYEFIGWKGDADSTDSVLTLPVDAGVTLEGMFAKIK